MLKSIRGYTHLKLIATGGYGEIYVGRHERMNREVAIKVISLGDTCREDFIQRFEFEAELIAHLEHPHIVPIYDYWHDFDNAFLVMRYLRGGNLASRLLRDGSLKVEEAAHLLEQIAGALSVAHRNGIIHQDIKPANILLDEDGNAYLTDFGIAHDIKHDVNLAQDTENTVHGSPQYIAPERLRRKEELTHRSDIYSLGIVMYEMLTGQKPFNDSNLTNLLRKQIHTPMPNLQVAKLDLPLELNAPLQKATMKRPSMRYDNVLDFAQDVQKIVTQRQYAPIL